MNACFRSLLFTGFFVLFLSSSFTIALASPYGSGNYSTSTYNGGGATGADDARSSLGMTIMHAFAGQLGGSLQVLEGPGTGLQVDIPVRR